MADNKPTVLYVDDVPMNLKLFEATFRNDYNLILTEYPGEVLQILREKEVQVVVSDQRMPEMTGTELLERVADEYPEIRRYLLTAFTDTETVIEAVNRGKIHGYIKKPIQPDAIRQSIQNSLEVYHLRKKNREMMTELERVNRELLRLDGLKSEIIHSITREISMPLSRIMGTLHLLKNKIEGDDLAEAVNILDQSVFKLEQFSLLTKQISILKSPGYQMRRNRVSLKQVIQFSAIETSEELREQQINLKRELTSPEAYVLGDSALLVSCLVSMIQFAREHTQVGGEIEIDVVKGNGSIQCYVRDQGANYSNPLTEMLTGHFTRGERDLNLNMGIGLAHSQLIMEVHGGSIFFERPEDSRGCLRLLFPLIAEEVVQKDDS